MMSTTNEAVRKALNYALGALFQLESAGSTVIDIQVRGDRATVLVDKPPKHFVGALHIRRMHSGLVERVMVASHFGCVVEWTETAPAPRSAVA
jgi:hypothetical protein